MKKMYFLKDRKEAVIDRLTYMSKHRQEYLQDKEHGMITLQFKQGMPVIRFSSGRVTSYWDFSFDGKKMTVQRRCSLSDKIIWGTLLMRIPLERNSLHASAGRLSAPNGKFLSYTGLRMFLPFSSRRNAL